MIDVTGAAPTQSLPGRGAALLATFGDWMQRHPGRSRRTALLVGGWISLWLAVVGQRVPGHWPANAIMLAGALTPLAGVGLFVGLSGLTTTFAHAEGMRLAWLPFARTTVLVLGGAWSLALAHRQLRRRVTGLAHRLALSAFAIGVAGVLAAWVPFVLR